MLLGGTLKNCRYILVYNSSLFWCRELNPEVCSTISDILCIKTELQVNIQIHLDSSQKSVEIQRT